MSDTNELNDLRNDFASMAAELRSVRGELDDLRSHRGQPTVHHAIPETVSRRGWMKAAAAAAVGGTAIAVGQSQPAVAASGMQIGADNADDARTVGDHTGVGGPDISFLFKTRLADTGEDADFPAALAGWSGSPARPNGMHGLAAENPGEGVGVIGESRGDRGTGVRGIGWYGVIGTGTDYGVAGTGKKGSLLVSTSGFVPPIAVPVEALPGAIYGETTDPFSNTGSVWCAVSKSGEWRKMAGLDTAGSLHPVEPTRVYDSRLAAPDPGKVATGESRTFSVASGRDLDTGAVTELDFVPAGTLAVAYNLTVTETEGAGFLAITPGTSTAFKASTINWSTGGQIVANAGMVPVDGLRSLKAFCGGSGRTHFLIDITGYYL